MIRPIIEACLGGKLKFYRNIWNGYVLEAGHNDWRNIPILSYVPYFWDSDVSFDMGINIPPQFGTVSDIWKYQWELRDLDGQLVKRGEQSIGGEGVIEVTNKGFRRKMKYWNAGKLRAFTLGNLHPHKEYILYAIFVTSKGEQSDKFKIASLAVEDRTSHQFQIFLILFTIFISIYFTAFARACGVTP